MSNLKGRDFITLSDFTTDEIIDLLELTRTLKRNHKNGHNLQVLAGKTLGMIFKKNSTRTRVSFAASMSQLGGQALSFLPEELQLARGESLSDTAKVLSRYLDALLIRTHEHTEVTAWADGCTIPVVNGLSDLVHPTQALADFFTLWEIFGKLKGLHMAYTGDGNNMLHSLLIGAAKLGVNLKAACPPGYEPSPLILSLAKDVAQVTGASISIMTDPFEAVTGSDALYCDVWTSMGQDPGNGLRKEALKPYQVNRKLFSVAKPDAVFLHCLPCVRGEEVTADVVDGPSSVVFDEAENRLHAHKAILVAITG